MGDGSPESEQKMKNEYEFNNELNGRHTSLKRKYLALEEILYKACDLECHANIICPDILDQVNALRSEYVDLIRDEAAFLSA